MASNTSYIPLDKAAIVRKMRRRSARFQCEGYILLVLSMIAATAVVIFFVNAPPISISLDASVGGAIQVDTINFPNASLYDLIKESILRIGSVVVAIFLMQILVAFARYRLRLAEYIDWRADLIDLASGDLSQIKEIVSIFGLTTVEFVNFPKSPIEKIAESAIGAVKR